MVAFEVHVQQLLLSEGLVTLAAGERFLSSVSSAMHHHVALLLPTQKHNRSQSDRFVFNEGSKELQ